MVEQLKNPSRLKIAILTIRMTKGFGVDVVVDQQARGLCARGHQVTVFCLEHDQDYFSALPYGIRVVGEPNDRIVRFLQHADFDVILAHTSPFFEILPRLTTHKRTIAYEHGDPSPYLFPPNEADIRNEIKLNKLHHVYPGVERVIAISQFIREDIKWPAAKVIYNGGNHLITSVNGKVSEKASREELEAFCASYEIDKGKLKILCVSRLGLGEANYKGFDLFVDFKKKFPASQRFEFVILGRGSNQDRANLERKGIKVILNASQAELMLAYQMCDVFVSLSKWEGFNLPLIEAQNFGKPAFAMQWCCHAEVTPLTVKNIKKLAQQISQASADQLIEWGQQCQAFIQQFTWQRNVETLEALLLEVVGQSTRGAPLKDRQVYHEMIFRLYEKFRGGQGIKKIYRLLKRASEIHPPHQGGQYSNSPSRDVATDARKQLAQPAKEGLRSPALVSVCILTKNKLEFIQPCIAALMQHTDLSRIEILVGDTGSTADAVLEYYAEIEHQVQIHYFPFYNFAEVNNLLAAKAQGEVLVFLNNDTRVEAGWLAALMDPFAFAGVGVVGPKLLFADETIQHAGCEIFTQEPYRYVGWHPYAKFAPDYAAANKFKIMPGVTGACLAIRADLFWQVGGFDCRFHEECQDIDLCIKAKTQGYKVIYAPQPRIYHFENGTRQLSESQHDRELFRQRWQGYLDASVFSNPTQSLDWHPAICVTVSENSEKITRQVAQLQEVLAKVKTMGLEAVITLKIKDKTPVNELKLHAPWAFLSAGTYRVIPADYEDSYHYDHYITD